MTHEIVPADAPRASTQRLSIVAAMAASHNMEQDTFMATLRATVFPNNMRREEEAAFLLVAKHHNLNPVTREIYAMPKKGGGIIPVVSIDGWVRMANEHPAFDGVEFEDHHDGATLISTTCRIYRKDRRHPIAVTEYLKECKRPTEPWNMEHRMLRHKALIQCARYAFGFAGIYDPDEAERFAEPLVGGVEPRRAPSPPPMIEAPAPRADMMVTEAGEIVQQPERQAAPAAAATPRRAPSPGPAPQLQPKPAESAQRPAPAQQQAAGYDPEKVRARFEAAAKAAEDRDALNEAWERIIGPHWDDEPLLQPGAPDRDVIDRIYRMRASEMDGEGSP